MEIIHGRRLSGKTTKLLNLALNETNCYIILPTFQQCLFTRDLFIEILRKKYKYFLSVKVKNSIIVTWNIFSRKKHVVHFIKSSECDIYFRGIDRETTKLFIDDSNHLTCMADIQIKSRQGQYPEIRAIVEDDSLIMR